LGRDILIVDIDMRSPNGENEVFNNATKMAREAEKGRDSGLLTIPM
jgi:hypothetical protein